MTFESVDAVLAETRTVQQRLRDLRSRVGMYFLLAMRLFPEIAYGWSGTGTSPSGGSPRRRRMCQVSWSAGSWKNNLPAVPSVTADHPLARVLAASGGGLLEARLVEDRVVIPKPEDLHSASRMDLHVVLAQDLVVEARFGEVRSNPPCSRGEQGVGAVVLTWRPTRGIFA